MSMQWDDGGFGFGFGYGYGGGRRRNPNPGALARIAAAEAAAKASAAGQRGMSMDQAQMQAMADAEKARTGAAERIAAAQASAKAAAEEKKAKQPKETEFFRSFLNTTREEHRERLTEATTSLRDANLTHRASSARSAAAEGQDEKEQKRRESVTKTYCDFLISKRQQSARERIKEMKKYGYGMEGREQHSLLDDLRVDRREGERRFTFPLARGQSVREPSFLKDISSISFGDATHSSEAGKTGQQLGALVEKGAVKWQSPTKKYNVGQMEDWDMSMHESSFAEHAPSFLERTSSPQTDKSFATRRPSFLKAALPDRRSPRSADLSRFLNEGPETEFPYKEREGLSEEAQKKKHDQTLGTTRTKDTDRELMEPSYLKDLTTLSGYKGEAIYKGELSEILKEGKSEWDKPADTSRGGKDTTEIGGDMEKSFVEVLEQLKEEPEKAKDYLINDTYFPGVIDDAINRKLDFNKLAFTLTYFDESIPDEVPPAEKQPISLIEAFDKRFDKHSGAINKATQNAGGSGRAGEFTDGAASTTTMDKGDMPGEVSRTRMLSFLPTKVSLTRILNREEVVLASTVPIDVSTVVQNRPVNELMKAMNSLKKAEFMNDYDKSAQAAEEAFKRAPPELAESAAIFGAKNFRTVESTRKHATVKRDSNYRPIEVVSYMGITKPMPGVKV